MAGFDVVITGFRLNARESPARVLERLLGFSADEARQRAKKFPLIAKSGVSRDQAESLMEMLSAAGARVELAGEEPDELPSAPAPAPRTVVREQPAVLEERPFTSQPPRAPVASSVRARAPSAPPASTPVRNSSLPKETVAWGEDPPPLGARPAARSSVPLQEETPFRGASGRPQPGASARQVATSSRPPPGSSERASAQPAARASQAPTAPGAPAPTPPRMMPSGMSVERALALAQLRPSRGPTSSSAPAPSSSGRSSSAAPPSSQAKSSWGPPPSNQQSNQQIEKPASVRPRASVPAGGSAPPQYALGDLELGGGPPAAAPVVAAAAPLPATATNFEAEEGDATRRHFELDLSGGAGWQGERGAAVGGASPATGEDIDEDAATVMLELDESALAHRGARIDKAPKTLVDLWLMSAPKATDAAVTLLVEVLGVRVEAAQRAVHTTPTLVAAGVVEDSAKSALSRLREAGLDVRPRKPEGGDKGGDKAEASAASAAGARTGKAGVRPSGTQPAVGARPSGTQPAVGARPSGTQPAVGTAKPLSGTQPLASASGSQVLGERTSASGEHSLAQPPLEVAFASRVSDGIVPPAPSARLPFAARRDRSRVLVGAPLFGLLVLVAALLLPQQSAIKRVARAGGKRAAAAAAVAAELRGAELRIAGEKLPVMVHLTLAPAEPPPGDANAPASHGLLIGAVTQEGAIKVHFEGHFQDSERRNWTAQGSHPSALLNREITVEPDVGDAEPSVVEWPDGRRAEIAVLRVLVQQVSPSPAIATDKLAAYEGKAELVMVLLTGEPLKAELQGQLEVLR